MYKDRQQLIINITLKLGVKPFTNNADWGSCYVWPIGHTNNYVGQFILLNSDDDELYLINRILNSDEDYETEFLKKITSLKQIKL